LSTRRKNQTRYTAIKIAGNLFYEHLLVLALHDIKVPEGTEVDHIDRDPTNNLLSNLRVVNRSTNIRRRKSDRKPQREIGVDFFRGRWRARITIDGERLYLGSFDSKHEAIQARAKHNPDPLP
jgi:hypothetical protein